VIVQQPDRDPVIMPPASGIPPRPRGECNDAAEKLLNCLGIDDPDVKRVRIKSVSIEVDLKEPNRDKDC